MIERRLLCFCLVVTLSMQCNRENAPEPAHEAVPLPDLSRVPEAALTEAVKQAREAVLRNTSSVELWSTYADLLLAHAWNESAAQCYEQAELLEPGNFLWPYRRALALSGFNPSLAAQSMERALELDARYAPSHVKYAALLVELGRGADARKEYELAFDLDSKNVDALHGLGRTSLAAGDLATARRMLEQALGIAPEHPELHETLAQVLFRLGDPENAKRHAEEARRFARTIVIEDPRGQPKSNPISSIDFFQKGMGLADAGRVDEAIEAWKRSLDINPNREDTHFNLGLLYLKQQKWEEAASALHEALRINPSYREAVPQLGYALRRLGKLDEAREQFLKVLAEDPSSGAAHLELAQIALAGGDASAASQHVREALKLHAEDVGLTYLVALKLGEQSHVEASAELLTTLLQNHPDAVEAHHELGVLFGRLNRVEDATREFRAVLALDPKHAKAAGNLATACFSQGTSCMQKGDGASAVPFLQEALTLRPGWPLPHRLLAWILATDASDQVRDPARALELAEELRQQSTDEDPQVLDTVAAAYAANGRFEDAVKYMEQAIAAATRTSKIQLLERLERRLALYQAGQPFRAQAGGRSEDR